MSISKEIFESNAKFEMYEKRLETISDNPMFDMIEYDLYDPLSIQASTKDKLYHDYYINSLLRDKYYDVVESLSNELKRLKRYRK